jgi:hypothetical protein
MQQAELGRRPLLFYPLVKSGRLPAAGRSIAGDELVIDSSSVATVSQDEDLSVSFIYRTTAMSVTWQ